MIADKLLQVSENQAATATAVSTHTIDLQTARDIGAGQQLFAVFTVSEAFVGGASLIAQVIRSENEDLSSESVLAASNSTVADDLALGDQIVLVVPPIVNSKGDRYLGAKFEITNGLLGGFTAGKMTVDFTLDIENSQKYYASGITV